LVAVLSAAPLKPKKGSSWRGSPPVHLRRAAASADQSRTFAPPTRLKVARGAVEACRIIPTMCSAAIGVGVLLTLDVIAERISFVVAGALSGLVLLAAGAGVGGAATVAQWALVGRTRVTEDPLWSPFGWRDQGVGTFVELGAAPWFANAPSA